MSKIIMGIQVQKRNNVIPDVQPLLTEYGCYIKTRIGLHDASDDRKICSENGLLVLEFIHDAEDEAEELSNRLSEIGGVTVKTMAF
jgi:hypothetical protein